MSTRLVIHYRIPNRVSGLELAAARPGDFEIPGVRISLVAEHA